MNLTFPGAELLHSIRTWFGKVPHGNQNHRGTQQEMPTQGCGKEHHTQGRAQNDGNARRQALQHIVGIFNHGRHEQSTTGLHGH